MRLVRMALCIPRDPPGDGWRDQHDDLKWRLHDDARAMTARAKTERYCLFSALLPSRARQALDQLPARKRQGLVPNLLLACPLEAGGADCEALFEINTIHYGHTTHPSAEQRCAAVASRAPAVSGEYLAKARRLDQTHCGMVAPAQGPVELKLHSFGTVRALVFGAWGEASADVETLLGALAKQGAQRHSRSMACARVQDACGALTWFQRRR